MVNDLIEKGLEQHRTGRLQEAKILYEQALAMQPRHPDALHLAGVVALQFGEIGRAVALIQQAIEVQPENPGFHANLAQAYLAGQRAADAYAAFRRAAALDPRNPQFATGAANCLATQGRAAEAEQLLRDVLRRDPGYAPAWYNLGNAVLEQGRKEEAADLYRRAIALEPEFADAHNNLGRVLHLLERFEEAEQAYRRRLALQPDSADGYRNLASVLMDRGAFGEAATACQQGIGRCQGSTDLLELHLLLAGAFVRQGKLTAAVDAARAAVMLAPASARARWALGGALFDAGDEKEGLDWLARAQDLQEDLPGFHHAMAGVRLSSGDLRAGWREYEWRPARLRFLAASSGPPPVRELPGSLSGKKVCVLREQGLGDELFFLRFAPALKSRGAEITFRASAKIASMLERVPALDRIIAGNEPLPAADFVMLAGDLPHALGASDFPPPLALAPLPEQLQSMKQQLAALGPPPYIGLTWRAGTAPDQQRGTAWVQHKAVSLQELGAALRGVNGTFLAVQRMPKPGEIEELAACLTRPVHDFAALNEDLEAMLALLALMDDYIGVSNANMHLRAAAGRAARVLVQRPAEWRWMAKGDESPWFPGFRIYRQDADGDWRAAFDRLRQDLQSAFGARRE